MVCLEINLERNYLKVEIAVHTDSQAAVEDLSSYVIVSKLISKCQSKLNEASRKNKLSSIWVQDHSRIADPEPFCDIRKCSCKEKFLEKEKTERG